jgi:hypothetical protein
VKAHPAAVGHLSWQLLWFELKANSDELYWRCVSLGVHLVHWPPPVAACTVLCSTPDTDSLVICCAYHETLEMKQFTRRNSKVQLSSSETVSTTSQQGCQGALKANKTSQQLSSDPYSFDIEDDTGSKQAKQTATTKLKEVQVWQQSPYASKAVCSVNSHLTLQCTLLWVCLKG